MSTAPQPKLQPPQPPVPPDFMPSLFGLGAGEYQVRPTNFIVSFVLHSVAVALLLTSGYWMVKHQEQIKQTVTEIFTPVNVSDYVMSPDKKESGGGGGGGDRDKLQASKGALPKQAREQFTPPAVVIRNNDPKLPVEPTVVAPPISAANMANMGDPLANVLGPPSNGTGSGGAIGS